MGPMAGGDGLMTGMLWAGALLIVVPLLIGVGVGIVLYRRRSEGR